VAGSGTSNISGTVPDTLDKVEKIDSDNVCLVVTKRGLEYWQGDYQNACGILTPALASAPLHPEISYHAVAILCLPNRESEAIRFLDAAVQRGQPFSGDAKHLRMQFLTEKAV
jgi:hypothetical protein